MKFTIARETLLAPLQQVIGVIEKRQTLPILSNVLVRIKEGQIELTGTDLEVQLITRGPIDTNESVEVTVPARKLLDIFRLLPERSLVNVDISEDRFSIRCGGSRFNLTTLPVENYPAFDNGATELEVSVPSDLLRAALNKTTFAMAQQDVRYYLNGILLDLDGAALRTVSSDGHRLAVFQESIPAVSPSNRQIIIPRKGVLELARLLSDADDSVLLQIAPNTVRINLGAVSFSAKLVEGKFPDFQRVMPKELNRIYTIDKDTLKSALTRVSVLSNEKYKSISVDVDANGLMAIKAQNPEHEEAEERLTVKINGSGISVGFNAAYLIDAVNNIDSETVRLSFTEAANSCLIEDAIDNRFKFIVMPMRL